MAPATRRPRERRANPPEKKNEALNNATPHWRTNIGCKTLPISAIVPHDAARGPDQFLLDEVIRNPLRLGRVVIAHPL